MTISHLKTNRLVNPLGYQLGGKPGLSWIVESETAKFQSTAQVQVSLDIGFENIVFDSGRRTDINSICYSPDIFLSPRTRYYWRVMVWGDDGSGQSSEPAWFETSKIDEPWNAQWITPDFDNTIHPILFTNFSLQKKAANARIYICGLGLYEIILNEEKVGDECLSPGFTAYDKWIPYQTFDITSLVSENSNHIEVMLGNGWYKGSFGLRKKPFRYGDNFALICEIVVTYTDKSTEVFTSNDITWKARKSKIIDSNIYDGEIYDATLQDNEIYTVVKLNMETSRLEPRRSPPIKIMERIRPVEIIHTPLGETVLDMGQNMVGWLEFTNRTPRGTELFLQFGEVLQEGNFYRENLRSAKCEYRFISNGEHKKIRPFFTFYGFRYIKLTKWHGEVNLNDFCGLVLYSDMEITGSITTDNELVNRLFLNALWGQKGNFLDVPTDCPQRDERLGWTGDAQIFSGTAAFNMDVYAFFDKYLYDLMQEQRTRGGNVPVVVPAHNIMQNGSCAWGDASVIIPWNMYLFFGDVSVLVQQYESMKGWVDYIRNRDEAAGGSRLWMNDYHFGDWLSLDTEDPSNRFGGTEATFLASAFYSYSSGIVAKAARILNRESEALFYEKLSEEIKSAIRKEYFTAAGRLAINTQTAHILALYMDLAPEKWKNRIAYDLRCKLKNSSYHLRTGFIGTPFLCRVLSEYGSNDIAYRLLTNIDYPGWLYPVTMGATTIWERWNSILPDGTISDTGMNSLNHYAYGSILEWMYRNAGGIQPIEGSPGFKRFSLRPQPDYLLKSFSAEFLSPAGKIISRWEIRDDGSVCYYFKIPFDTVAEVTLVDAEGTQAEGVQELVCGEYTFSYMPLKPYKKSFCIDSSIKEIYGNPQATAILETYLPDMTKWLMFRLFAGERSILDLIRQGYIHMDESKHAELDDKLREILQ